MLVEEKGINDFSLILSYVRISGVQVIQTQVEPNGYFAICVGFFFLKYLFSDKVILYSI